MANGKPPPATLKEHIGPIPSHRISLEANLMTSAHFFQTHPSSLSQNLSAFGSFPCREAKTGLRALEGAPSQSLLSAPTPQATVLACSAGPLSRHPRQRNHK